MRFINPIIALLLAATITLLAQFSLGSQQQHGEAVARHFWSELSLRFVFWSVVGLIGAGLWWSVNYGLVKSGLVRHVNLRQIALLLMVGVIGGALAGALLFCLS